MRMHDPSHPGEFIKEVYHEPFSLSHRKVVAWLDVAPLAMVWSLTPEQTIEILSYVTSV